MSTRQITVLDTILGDPMRRVSTEFNDYTRKFDELIKELLKNSENGFHTMFTRTYGQRYEKHARLFSNMFTLLTKYYSYNNVNLDSEFTKFFTDLYQKIFIELNNHYIFSDDYLKCVAAHMETINPFGDIPRKLVIEVQRSFTAARVFIQSLVTASEISKTVAEHSATPNCHKFFVQMNYCQQCEDSPDRVPCRNYCNAVMHTCTTSYRPLNKEWNPFLDKLTAIISRLETSFNIESVVGPLDIKISEAIMNFQENGMTVSKRLYSICGKPKRGKRLAINRRPTSETSPTLDNRSPTASKSPLDNFLDSTKKQLKKMKDFWQRLPETVCNNSVIPATIDGSAELNNKPCWSQEDGSMQPLTDKSSEMDEKVVFINSQRALLRNVNSKLDAAFRGSDIPEDEDLSGSGSGSGDGDYDDDDYPDDDEPDDYDVPKSSTAPPVSSVSPVSVTVHNSSTTVNKTSSTKADNVTTIPIPGATQEPQNNPATPKGSSSLVEKSSLMIISLTFLSILIGQTL
uniref:Glypican n=1 Tax=Tetranychus urticae TaxID=32264 RepID=T1KRY2_TETUR